jgi:DNA-binding GntR family transcriptional regulator
MPLPTEIRVPHRTKQEFVYLALRRAILRCELLPGERLVIEDLAERLDVSSIPVREALQLLQSEGLVDVVPHAGASVAPLSRESILDVFSILEGLQIVAARLAAERATAEDLEQMRALVHAMEEAVSGKGEEWSAMNARFHVAIARATGLPMLLQMTEQAFDRWDRTRRYFFSDVLAMRVLQAQREHHAILEALRERDSETLARLMRAHSQHALRDYLHHLDTRVETELAKTRPLSPDA